MRIGQRLQLGSLLGGVLSWRHFLSLPAGDAYLRTRPDGRVERRRGVQLAHVSRRPDRKRTGSGRARLFSRLLMGGPRRCSTARYTASRS